MKDVFVVILCYMLTTLIDFFLHIFLFLFCYFIDIFFIILHYLCLRIERYFFIVIYVFSFFVNLHINTKKYDGMIFVRMTTLCVNMIFQTFVNIIIKSIIRPLFLLHFFFSFNTLI